MQVIETKVYTFDELDESAKERAREWYRSADDDFPFHAECIEDDAKTIGELMGIEIDKIYYCIGSYRGTDGACFTGYYSYKRGGAKAVAAHVGDSDSCKEVKRIARELQTAQHKAFYGLSACVKHQGRDYTAFDTTINVGYADRWESPPEAIAERIEELLRDFMHWIYKALDTEYEYQNSDESVDENITINEYTFTEEGRRFG